MESTGPGTHVVTLPDGADAYHVELVEDHGRFLGYCDSKGFEYNDGPCAHLCTVRQAAFIGLLDINSRRITIPPLSSVRVGTDSAVATDGGEVRYDDVSERTGYSISQVYRALDEIGDALENEHGLIRFFSEKIRQEITAIVNRVGDFVEDGAAAIARLANVETRSAADSAIQKWMNKYGASFDHDGDGKIRIDTVLSDRKYGPHPHVADVLQEGLDAWSSAGRDYIDFVQFEFEAKDIVGRNRSGGLIRREEIDW